MKTTLAKVRINATQHILNRYESDFFKMTIQLPIRKESLFLC